MGAKRYDWEAIEREYRAGQKSNRELAAEFGCSEAAIRKRARAGDWQRDLGEQARQKAANELLTDSEAKTEKEAVEQGARKIVEVVRAQRERIRKLTEFADELIDAAEKKAKTPEEGLKKKSAVLKFVTPLVERLMAMERQVYNIDKGFEPKKEEALLDMSGLSDEQLRFLASGNTSAAD